MTAPPHDREPIWVRCEGSGCPPATGIGNGSEAIGMCSMCGQWLSLTAYIVDEHVRDDILARVHRGDFG